MPADMEDARRANEKRKRSGEAKKSVLDVKNPEVRATADGAWVQEMWESKESCATDKYDGDD